MMRRSSRLLVATRNRGKLLELRALLGALGLDVVDLTEAAIPETAAEDGLESFSTFEENALAKAAYFQERSGLPTVADDSGLVVTALGGQPGVRSKRFAGVAGTERHVAAANNAKVIAALDGTVDRTARFVCAAAYVDGAARETARADVSGHVLSAPRGREGFGYDPYFFCDELGKTFAEASVAEKEKVSHRGRAFRALAAKLLRVDARPGGE